MQQQIKHKAIVVVEDHEPIATLLKEALNDEPDYQTAVVRDGCQAVEVIRSVKTSLVLLDIDLPGINGLQVYDLLQDDDATRDIPVIFVTARPDPREFRKRDIRSYIEKPFDLNELLGKVAAVCRA